MNIEITNNNLFGAPLHLFKAGEVVVGMTTGSIYMVLEDSKLVVLASRDGSPRAYTVNHVNPSERFFQVKSAVLKIVL